MVSSVFSSHSGFAKTTQTSVGPRWTDGRTVYADAMEEPSVDVEIIGAVFDVDSPEGVGGGMTRIPTTTRCNCSPDKTWPPGVVLDALTIAGIHAAPSVYGIPQHRTVQLRKVLPEP